MNTKLISKQESSLLSLLRILATESIIVCHILQTLDNRWAYIFNIGVQVFFVLSGYLYGHKAITGWGSWFKGRFQKLYIPFIIIVLFFIVLYSITGLYKVTSKIVLVYVFNLQGLIGGGINL